MSDEELVKALRSALWGQGHHINIKAADRIEQLEARNKELTLQLLATSGQAADALDKLAKVTAAFRVMLMRLHEGYTHQAFDAYIAELEGKE